MVDTFASRLSQLRKECGLNQRSAAVELKISQALLSHYENGIREPGLEFVVRACNFYGVSADYLLGRTAVRDGSAIVKSKAGKDKSASKDALTHKRRLVSAVGLMFDCFGKELDAPSLKAFASHLYAGLCQALILLPIDFGEKFNSDSRAVQTGLELSRQRSAARLLASAAHKKTDLKTLEKQFPERFRDFDELITAAQSDITQNMDLMEG